MSRLPTLAALVMVAAGCGSPEAGRERGQPGADVGNRGTTIEFHAGAKPYFGTPCVSSLNPCTGPLPLFGPQP